MNNLIIIHTCIRKYILTNYIIYLISGHSLIVFIMHDAGWRL